MNKRLIKTAGLVLLILVAVVFWGKWLLDLFGVIKYDLPLSQSTQNIVQVDLLDSRGPEFIVLRSVTGEELDLFIVDIMEIEVDRYVNDPQVTYDERTVKICYADGGYELLGGMVEFFNSSGERLPVGGWFHISPDDVQTLFNSYGAE